MIARSMSRKYLLLLVLFLSAYYAPLGLCQTFPNRTVSPLLKLGTSFLYLYHATFSGQEKDININITIKSVEGQQIAYSAWTSDPTLIVNSGVTNVGDLPSFGLTKLFPFVGTNLNVGDPLFIISGQSYVVQNLGEEDILGKSRIVISLQDTEQIMKWDREGGFPILMASQGITPSITMILIDSNVVFQGGNDWLSEFLTEIGCWVASALELNMNPVFFRALGLATILCIVVAIVLGVVLMIKFVS